MTTWTVILFAVALVWTLLLAVISVIFADEECKEREDLQKQKETLRRMEYAFRLREDNYKEALEVFNREKEQFKERELNLAARKESVLELEATLLNKQNYLAELGAKLKAGAIPIVSKEEWIEELKQEREKRK